MTPTLNAPPHDADPDRILGRLVRSSLTELDRLLTRLWQADALTGLALQLEAAATPAAVQATAGELRRQADGLVAAVRDLELIYERLELQTEASTLLAEGLPPVDLDAPGAGR